MAIPTLTTERLTLCAPDASDFDAFVRLWQLPEVYQYILGKPRTRKDSWAAFLQLFGAWSHLGYGMWLVKRRDTGVVIGQCGFLSAMRGHGGAFDELPEVGWLFEAVGQGQGFAHEAMAAALAWFDGADVAKGSVCMVDPDNGASLVLADKLGFSKTRLSEFDGVMMQLFERHG